MYILIPKNTCHWDICRCKITLDGVTLLKSINPYHTEPTL